MATRALVIEQQAALVDCFRGCLRRDCRRWRFGMSEWLDRQRRRSADSKCEQTSVAGFTLASTWCVECCIGTAPAGHDRFVLFAIDEIRYRRCHDSGACIEFPELLSVRRTICGEHAVGPALNHKVAGCRQHAAAFD